MAHTLGTANGQYVTDDFTCHYCLRSLTVVTRTKDHIVPRALGGMDTRQNIVMSCRSCNSAKANTWPTCKCSKCAKTRRTHWEVLRISDPGKKRKK